LTHSFQPNENVENPITFRFEIENSNRLVFSDHTAALRQAGVTVHAQSNFWLFDSGTVVVGDDRDDVVWSRYRWNEPIKVDRINGTLIVKLGNVPTPYD
jgi:hypothetical protein